MLTFVEVKVIQGLFVGRRLVSNGEPRSEPSPILSQTSSHLAKCPPLKAVLKVLFLFCFLGSAEEEWQYATGRGHGGQ